MSGSRLLDDLARALVEPVPRRRALRLLDETNAVPGAYRANGTPSAVLVATDGTIASPVAAGGEWIEALVAEALDGLRRPPGLPIGSDAPATELEALEGGRIAVSRLVAR